MSTAGERTDQACWKRLGAALGFHVPMLAFAMRTSVAAFVALLVAQAIGLEHPHWAAMSVWASSQPMREHLLSRSAYRFGGSVVGVAYAVVLVLVAQNSLWVLAGGVALWGAVCAFFGNLQRGYMVYGWMLSGYSAAMVVLLHHGPAETIWPLAWDRMLTVVTGVLTALCISWCFAPRRKTAVLIAQNRQALAQVLQAAVGTLRPAHRSQEVAAADLLSRMAEVEELLELYPEGSRTARHTSRAMHWQQHYAMDLVYHLHQQLRDAQNGVHGCDWAGDLTAERQEVLAQALQQLSQALQAPPDAAQAAADLPLRLAEAQRQCEAAVAEFQNRQRPESAGLRALYLLLQALRRGLRVEMRDLGLLHAATGARSALDSGDLDLPLDHLHRDWIGARQAAVRAGGTLLVVGIVWAMTGASIVGFAMLGLATMLLVFSAFESPSRTMAFVLRGQLIGAGLALLCQTLVWPLAQSAWQMVWLVLPFALIAGLVFAHKRTAVGALDTSMAMFILLAPSYPDMAGVEKHLSYALAVVSGPALAWVMYRCIYPTNAQRRMRTLAQMVVAEVPAMARRLLQEEPSARWRLQPVLVQSRWQARLHHRLLRLVRWADKTRLPQRATLPDLGAALRAVQAGMLQLQQWRTGTILATASQRRASRRTALVLQRTAQWGAADNTAEAGRKLLMAWQALAQQPGLPPSLAATVQHIARRDLVVLQTLKQDLH